MMDPFKKNPTKSAEKQAAELQALVAASREERAAVSTMLAQVQAQTSKLMAAGKSVQDLDADLTKLDARAEQARERLDRLQAGTSALADELRQVHDVSRMIRDETAAVAAVARDIEQALGTIAHFQQLSRAADERLAALHALAEQASQKLHALNEQALTVERAVERSARFEEMLGRVQGQITRLEEAERRVQATLVLAEQVGDRPGPVAPGAAQLPSSREEAAGVRSSALVEMLDQLQASVEEIAGRAGMTPFAATSCIRLRDMAREAQSTLTALHQG